MSLQIMEEVREIEQIFYNQIKHQRDKQIILVCLAGIK